ncbi:MAG: outer membrane beta-barrel protein [Prevotella sp.]|nr:outer membrane beta-barrel protein [Prevotella sp.]
MKKIMMTLAAAFVAVSMNAQVYVGGSLGINAWSSQKNAGDRSETTFSVLPEVGYNFNDEWAVGTVIGYESDKWAGIEGVSENAFTFNPYVRYTFAKAGKVNFFVDGAVDFTSASDADWTSFGVGLKPGLAVNLTDNISFVSHLGLIGWQQLNPDGDDNSINKVGLDLSGNNLTFGLYFNF